eukprot:c23817_g1_i1 orf=964-1617(-)
MTRVSSSKRKGRPLCPAAVLLAATLLSTFFVLRALPPSPSSARNRLLLPHARLHNKASMDPALGRYGELILTFIRPDLPFTVFIPSPSSFESMLLAINGRFNTSGTLSPNSTVFEEESNYAVISRVFGFGAVPRRILSGMVPFNGEIGVDSVSGFRLILARLPPKGTLIVNNLACSTVDIIKGSIVVHLVDGVLMDSDFEQSVIPFQDDLDESGGMP